MSELGDRDRRSEQPEVEKRPPLKAVLIWSKGKERQWYGQIPRHFTVLQMLPSSKVVQPIPVLSSSDHSDTSADDNLNGPALVQSTGSQFPPVVITYDLVEYEVVFKLFRIGEECGAGQRDLVCLHRDLESIIGNERKKRLERAKQTDTDKKGQSKCRIAPKGQGRLVNVLPLCLLAKFLAACTCLKDNPARRDPCTDL